MYALETININPNNILKSKGVISLEINAPNIVPGIDSKPNLSDFS